MFENRKNYYRLALNFTTILDFIFIKVKVKVKSLGHVPLFAIPCTAAYQAPPSMRFSRQVYWCGLPFPSRIMLPTPKRSYSSPPSLNQYLLSPLCAKHLFSNEDKLLMIQALKKTRSCFPSKPFTAIHFHQLRNSFHLRVMYIMNTDLFTFMVLITTLSNQRKC